MASGEWSLEAVGLEASEETVVCDLLLVRSCITKFDFHYR